MRNKNALKNFVIMADNVRGIRSKVNSLQEILDTEKPVIMGVSETKLKDGSHIEKFEGYEMKRADRKKEGKDGGGVMFIYKEEIKNIIKVVNEEREKAEMLWMRLDNNVVKARLGVVYMPQEETKTVDELKEIYQLIETEVETAAKQNEILVLMGDFNCKVGSIIPGNTDNVTKGGRILMKLLDKHNLCILNGEEFCSGKWTRIEGSERSILDYVITRKEDRSIFSSMHIDEEKLITPYNVEQEPAGARIVYTDHCMMKVKAAMIVHLIKPQKRRKQLDKKRCHEFANELTEERVSELIDKKDIVSSYARWSQKVMEICDKYSTEKTPKKGRSKCNRLLVRSKSKIVKKLKESGLEKEEIKTLKKRKELIMEHIDRECKRENRRKVDATVKEVKEGGGVDSTTFWKVKKRLMGQNKNEVAAIIDEDGNKKEDPEEVKEVYMKYFSKLLATDVGTTDEERKREELVKSIVENMEIVGTNSQPQEAKETDIREIVAKLDVKKAKDRDEWSNEIVVRGGEEMLKSLCKITESIDQTLCVPGEWNKMAIKAVDKKGRKLLMPNKRGLFLTNIISKVYERIIKKRNEGDVKKSCSQWQMGGVKKRSPTDCLFITYSIIERNTYLQKPTYIFYADAEKCFDKLWLEDAVIELWRQGTNIRDAVMIKKMNEEARIIIHTPVGETEEITCHNIVRQGTVYGPQLCGVSMSRVNDIGRDIITMYGPNLIIRSTQFVDDVSSAGSPRAINNTIYNCNALEDTKKMTFNNTNGKTEYTVVHPANENETITNEVKSGKIMRVGEHKPLGVWIDERGTYMINIDKNKKRIPHMNASVISIGSSDKVGILAIETRLKLVNAVTMHSLLYGIEAVPLLKDDEIKQLEVMQHKIITQILSVPISTPYLGLLLETGMWKMRARVDYRKLMLFHNISNSEDERVIKKILKVQKEEVRNTTWYAVILKIMEKYEIELEVEEVMKSEWKKNVKKQIEKKMELEIREGCNELRKARTIEDDPYSLKQYLQECAPEEAADIIRARMHMSKLPCNYGVNSGQCPLCGFRGKVETEHYFKSCQRTKRLAMIWDTSAEDLKGSPEQLKKAKNHLKKVEVMMERYMPF